MKTIFLWLKSNLLLTLLLCCCVNPMAAAVAVVESRTGTPVVGSSTSEGNQGHSGGGFQASQGGFQSSSHQSSQPSSGRASSSAEDRAARMTLSQIESLQKEVGELRGLVETQEHEIKQLKKSQQDLYLDLDRRLNQLHAKTANTPAKTPSQKSTSPQAAVSAPNAANVVKTANVAASGAAKAGSAVVAGVATGTKPAVTAATVTSSAITPTTSSKASSSSSASSHSPTSKEQEAYQAAYGLVRTKHYPEAIAAFQDYLDHYPKGENRASAHYWMGEVYMVQWQADKSNTGLLDNASGEFSNLTSQHSTHPKAVDALLKLGIIEAEKGNMEAAERYFTQVKTDYPGTAAARIADTRLQQMAAD